jgi:hypothetical protein
MRKVVITDNPTSDKAKNIKALVMRLAIIPTIIGLRGAKMNPLNISLIGVWVLWLLFDAVLTVDWKRPLLKRITKNSRVRIALVVIVILVTAWFAIVSWRQPAPPSTKDIIEKTATEVSKRTRDETMAEFRQELSKLNTGEEQRLKEDYPFGCAMIAFSDDIKVVVPFTDRFETDWEKLAVRREGRNWIWVTLPSLRDKYRGNTWPPFNIGLPATPGAKSSPIICDAIIVSVECLLHNDVGIYAVLGFGENSSTNATK